jgi:hypothetical protein
MLSNLKLEIRQVSRPIWGLGFVERSREWTLTPSETMTDKDVYSLAQKFVAVGCDVNVVEEK